MNTENSRYDSTREAWENIWDGASVEVELEAVASARSMETINKYLPYLPKDAPIIEAGSGLSAVVITLRRLGYPIYGLDYAVNALEISRRYDPELALLGGDVHKLPFAENSLGAYLSFGVLEHFEQGMMPALDEAYRVLRPEGILVLTIPYPNIVNKLVAWKRRASGKSLLTDDSFYESTYTKGSLVGNVKAAGFKIEHVSPTSHSFTLRGLGGVFQAPGYYKTSALAEGMGRMVKVVAPWTFNYMTLVVARK
ncbi:MAG: group 1 glycosyl transferase [Chloroflexi bacterium OLB15]|nr:MAG: group 1 glycosyl transferase [Chloroflexi bacterium OLB15]